MNLKEKISIALGVIFISVLLVVAVFFPKPTAFQFLVFRVLLSLAAAGLAVTFDGFLSIQIPRFIKAGGALGVFVVVYFYNPALLIANPPEQELRFKSELDKSKIQVVKDITGQRWLSVTWTLTPLTQNNLETVGIVGGYAKVYDYLSYLPIKSTSEPDVTSCEDVPSCIGRKVFLYFDKPMLLRGGQNNTGTFTETIPIKGNAHKLYIWWKIFQSEADGGSHCMIDESKQAVSGHFPFIHAVGSSGEVHQWCYYDWNEETIGI